MCWPNKINMCLKHHNPMTANENISKFLTTQTMLNFLSNSQGLVIEKATSHALGSSSNEREIVPNPKAHIENQTSAYYISVFVTSKYYFFFRTDKEPEAQRSCTGEGIQKVHSTASEWSGDGGYK